MSEDASNNVEIMADSVGSDMQEQIYLGQVFTQARLSHSGVP